MALPQETGRTIAEFALKQAGITGVGKVANATQLNDALNLLNDMIFQWNTQRWMIWNLLDTGFTMTGQTTPYTVGPGGNYAFIQRPDRIEAAYVRQTNSGALPVDTPLKIIPAREQYSRVATKSLTSFPEAIFYDSAFNAQQQGLLYPYPWPSPAGLYEVHILTKNVVPEIEADTEMTNVPRHYLPAMKYNLARRLRQLSGKGRTPDAELNGMANGALEVVKNSNLQVPELTMPMAVVNKGMGYNIYSDSYGDS